MQLFSQCIGRRNHNVVPVIINERFHNYNFREASQQQVQPVPAQPVPVQPVQFENINALMPNITLNQVPNYEPSIYTSTAPEELNESSLPMDPQQLSSSQLSNPVGTSQTDPLRETIHSMTTKEVLELMKLDSKDDEEKLQNAQVILNKRKQARQPQPLNESSLSMDPQQLSSSQLSNPLRTSQADPLRETIHSMTTKEVLELMKLDSKDDEEMLQNAQIILNKRNHIRSYTSVLGSGKNINRIKYNKGDNSLLHSVDNLEQNISVNLSRNGATFEGPKVKSSRLPSGSIDITIEGSEDKNGNRPQVGQGHIHRNGEANGNIYA